MIKKLRKQLLESKSTEEVNSLKDQMHVAEVDLNYTQYCPLSEIYISLYPPKNEDEEEEGAEQPKADVVQSKPVMWAEVERRMEEGTLNKLRNRVPLIPIKKAKKPESKPKVIKPAKPKPLPAPVDTTGMNRRQRRAQGGLSQPTKTKNKSIAFEKNAAFGALEAAKLNAPYEKEEDGSDNGGFFEE